MIKEFNDHMVFGQKKKPVEIICDKAKILLDEINKNPSPNVNAIIEAMEHTRKCQKCTDYFIRLNALK